jgi:hypothetical protein
VELRDQAIEEGWKRLLAGVSWFRRPGHFPIAAYSEFMPPPRLGRKPYGAEDPGLFRADDPLGWHVTEYEEVMELRPGLEHLAAQLVHILEHLGNGRPAHGIARAKLEGNPYWPDELAERAGRLPHERYVVIAPLALSRTQDDKGRVRWTLFGGSEQGPARAFWKGFFTAPGREMAAKEALGFVRRLLIAAYGEPPDRLGGLHKAGFRILPGLGDPTLPYAEEEELPSWTKPYLLADEKRLRGVRYLLTFRTFGSLSQAIRRAYFAEELHLLPFPGSLVFWGARPYLRLRHELPFAEQIPLLHALPRHEEPCSVRVPQSGWMHEPHPDRPEPDPEKLPLRNTYRRTHRWARLHRHEDELAVADGEDRVAHVLFSSAADDVGLYGKPMARNAQIWTHDFRLLLDGPRADGEALERAAAALREGGQFGYRFLFPPMQVGRHAVYWHRPLVAFLGAKSAAPEVLLHAPLGYLTAYPSDRPKLDEAIELWPRLLARPPHVVALHGFSAAPEHHQRRITVHNVRKVLDAADLWGEECLPAGLARALLTIPKQETLEDWLRHVETSANQPEAGRELAEQLRRRIAPAAWKVAGTLRVPSAEADKGMADGTRSVPATIPVTYHRTATRSFEVAYWRTIARLAHGKYLNKDNADCARDPVSQSLLKHHHRDLDALGDYLLEYYRRAIDKADMAGKAVVGDLPFHWRTDFHFPWSGGWLGNQQGKLEERDLVAIIPGKNRRRAIIMGDHYDTAYMEDRYEKARGGNGARLAAAGADDNHSATATLMLAAPIFMELSRAGLLQCDVWLVHLTGEEFPSDCMGARHLAQAIVEGTLQLRRQDARSGTGPFSGGKPLPANRRRAGNMDLSPSALDISKVRIEGVYVLDMIAHNNDHDPDVFQISPGVGGDSLRLACHAHAANAAWNGCAAGWNRRAGRRHCARGRRSLDGATIPATALHPVLHGEVRTPDDPRSSLYNTDGQIFSDAGVPVVLFMENYDINRVGYHDTHDNMTNIDLDYGSAVSAIAIESVARAAAVPR